MDQQKDIATPTQVATLPGEQRGISSVNQTISSRLKHTLVMLVLLVSCIMASLAYWKYRHHIGYTSQETNQEDLYLTSAVPTRSFIDLPALPTPTATALQDPAPDTHLLNLDKNQCITPSPSYSSNKSKVPPVLDKSSSPLMAISSSSSGKHSSIHSSINTESSDYAATKQLTSTSTNMYQAKQLTDRNFILAKGSFINCALQTKLDSTVPGMTACIVTGNIYSDNGKIVLIERGSTVSGEYKANLQQGMARIFVLWTRIKTPNGIIVDLDSPGTDQLGGSGMPGYVDNHFWQRFGGALLLSLVDDVASGASARIGKQNKGQISFNETFSTTQDMATEALKNTINIPPTLYKNHGEQIGIYVAHDLDFSGVYDVTSY